MHNKTPTVRASTILSLVKSELPEQTNWIEPGVLPKSSMLLFGGAAKIGKSFMMLELVRALSTGERPFGHPQLWVPAPVRVLYVEREIGEVGLKKRIDKIFGPENEMLYGPLAHYVTKVPSLQVDTMEGKEMLDALCQQVQPNVLLLDPIGRMFTGDENKSEDVQELFNSLERLIKRYAHNSMSIVIAHHSGKPSFNPPKDPLDMYSFRGSSKWADCPDTILTVQRLGDIKRDWKAWEVKVRFECRQDEPPEEAILTVNSERDLRVRFDRLVRKKWEGTPKIEHKGGEEKPDEYTSIFAQDSAEKKLLLFPGGSRE